MEYNFREIEKKWHDYWIAEKVYKVEKDTNKPKYYVLDMFPYPSGAGLHVGHPLGYIASDIYSRFKRLQGFNVLHPMGYDAYGLPAEQYAIQTGQHPEITTKNNIARYREQLEKIGFCYDWSREIRTCDPEYYKWTQWAFIRMFNSYYCNVAHLWRAGDGRTGLRPAGCSAALQALRTVPGRLRLPVYFGGSGGPGGGQATLPAPPHAPAGCGAAPALGGARGVLCPLSLRRHGVLRRLFRRCGGGLGGGQIFKAPPVRLLPGAGARPASGARRGAGRLFLRRLLLWTGGSAPLGHSIHSRHCRAQRRAPSSGAALGGGGGAGDFRLSALVCRAGRRAGADAPGLCVLLCPGAVCVGVVSGGSGPGDVRALLHVSVAQLGCSGLGPGVACGGAEAQKIRP